MRELFKKHFALTDKGAKDLQKASAASFFVYVINFFPAMLLLLLVDELLLNNVKEMGLYLWGSVLVLAAMWILLRIEYDALYNTTYQESANLRTEIADVLTKLPLSYFSRHDLSDLAQTIMADVAAIEHAMSHAMAKAVGFLFFFPLLSVLLLLGNVKLGLAIILPILLGFGLLLLSKNLQIRESFKHYQKLRGGIGLGVLGIGLPDIPLFTGMVLKSIYETAISYGFPYDTEEEQCYILKLISTALSRGDTAQSGD